MLKVSIAALPLVCLLGALSGAAATYVAMNAAHQRDRDKIIDNYATILYRQSREDNEGYPTGGTPEQKEAWANYYLSRHPQFMR